MKMRKNNKLTPAQTDAVPVPPPEPGNAEIPGINMELALSLYDGLMEIFLAILYSYVKNVPVLLNKMRDVSEQSLPDYAIDIHAMKGNSSSIGAEDLTERAKRMEIMAKSGDLSGILAENEKFIEDAETLVTNIQAWLSKY